MEIIAQKRKELGKKVKSLRDSRCIPAVMFGKGLESIPLTLDLNRFIKVFSEAGETALVDINVDGISTKVLIKDVQYDPVKSTPIHACLHKVNLKEKIEANIPVEIVGAEENPLIKSGEGLVLVLLDEITVEALPADLPSNFTVDVSGITELGQGITVASLQYDKEKVEITDQEPDELVVKIDKAEMEEIVEEVSEEEALAQVQATEELSDEEKAAREAAAAEGKKEEKK